MTKRTGMYKTTDWRHSASVATFNTMRRRKRGDGRKKKSKPINPIQVKNDKMFIFWGKEKKYPALSWWENFMGGHIFIRLPFKSHITFFGENAMHWGVNWRVFNTCVCFRLPFRCFDAWWPLYFYLSPDGTPTSATFIIGKTDRRRYR